MTWIKTIPKSEADAAYKAAIDAQHAWYPREYGEQVPGIPTNDGDGIVAAHSLIPNALHHAFATFGTLMDPELPLTRRDHERVQTGHCCRRFRRPAACSESNRSARPA